MRDRRRNGVETFLTSDETHLVIIALQRLRTVSALKLAARLERRLP